MLQILYYSNIGEYVDILEVEIYPSVSTSTMALILCGKNLHQRIKINQTKKDQTDFIPVSFLQAGMKKICSKFLISLPVSCLCAIILFRFSFFMV